VKKRTNKYPRNAAQEAEQRWHAQRQLREVEAEAFSAVCASLGQEAALFQRRANRGRRDARWACLFIAIMAVSTAVTGWPLLHPQPPAERACIWMALISSVIGVLVGLCLGLRSVREARSYAQKGRYLAVERRVLELSEKNPVNALVQNCSGAPALTVRHR
jgi:xanthine/CO dehydrogenase XdhC/CoxF family maturation factor